MDNIIIRSKIVTATLFAFSLLLGALFLRTQCKGIDMYFYGSFLPFVICILVFNRGRVFPASLLNRTTYPYISWILMLWIYYLLFLTFASFAYFWLSISICYGDFISENGIIYYFIMFCFIVCYEVGFRDYLFYLLNIKKKILKVYLITLYECTYICLIVLLAFEFDIYILFRIINIFMQSVTFNLMRSYYNTVVPVIFMRIVFLCMNGYLLLFDAYFIDGYSESIFDLMSEVYFTISFFIAVIVFHIKVLRPKKPRV